MTRVREMKKTLLLSQETNQPVEKALAELMRNRMSLPTQSISNKGK